MVGRQGIHLSLVQSPDLAGAQYHQIGGFNDADLLGGERFHLIIEQGGKLSGIELDHLRCGHGANLVFGHRDQIARFNGANLAGGDPCHLVFRQASHLAGGERGNVLGLHGLDLRLLQSLYLLNPHV